MTPEQLKEVREITKAQIDALAMQILDDMTPTHGEQFLAFANLLNQVAIPPAAQANQRFILALETGEIAPYLIARLSLMSLLQIQLIRAQREAGE